jgi:hypothetical protein
MAATVEGLNTAIGCLATVYPQFVAKELAMLTDDIAAAIQGFTDPIGAMADFNLDSLVEGVADLSEGDVFSNMGEAAVGLTSQYAQREGAELLADMAEEYPNATKRVQQIRNASGQLVSGAYTIISLHNDIPYAVAQKICETIILLDDLKIKNLRCLKKHIVQLTNSVLVLVENATTFKDDTLEDLALAAAQVDEAERLLELSQPFVGGSVGFDKSAFDRAREALNGASRLLTPDKDGTSILDVVDILSTGSVEAGQINRSNQALVHLIIPSLSNLIQIEVSAVVSQIEVINFYVARLSELITSYRSSSNSSRVAAERARAIAAIKVKLTNLSAQMDLAVSRGSITQASIQMLAWSSRVKTIIETMNRIGQDSLLEGSPDGPDAALALANALEKLLDDLASINVGQTVNGIEDPTVFQSQVLSLTKYAKRIVEDIELGKVAPNTLATFHLLAAETANAQINGATQSISVALRQKAACEEFASIELPVRQEFDDLLSSMRQAGLDRAVDMLGSGQFSEFLDSDLDSLSYLGAAINCLTDAALNIDDYQTQKKITDIRDGMVAKKGNEDLALADSIDLGRLKFISQAQTSIASIQKNAKAVELIADTLKGLSEQLGTTYDESFGTLSLTTFQANLDHLQVGAGGRLSDGLEEYSKHPNGGVPLCEPV